MDKPLSSFADGWLIIVIVRQHDAVKKNRNRQQEWAGMILLMERVCTLY